MKQIVVFILCSTLFISCNYFKKETEEAAVARVNDTYLYEDDVNKLISEATSAEDSAMIISNYITRWATQQLLIDQAKINLSPNTLDEYNKLVQEYQNDLLTEAYKNVVVGKQLDSLISNEEYEEYYEANKENFKLNDVLVQMRYVQLSENYDDLANVKEKFSRYNEKDKLALNTQDFQFVSSNFNDSVWIKKTALLKALPVLKANVEQVLKKSNFTQLQDSLGVYLVKIENVLNLNDTAPLSYVQPSLEQIILNKRKLELIKKLETDITKDAIKTKKFQIYKNE